MSKQTSIQAGVAQIDITPPIGTVLTGFIARSGPATGCTRSTLCQSSSAGQRRNAGCHPHGGCVGLT